ncbi:UbiA-like protein EboC [uncultured Croceitalea sp.]|uniref:UbiA-like protein EboC n=1 Tax=uncultured Croceitalea sp. TaxID=1798908 RepID=UPI0033057803
MNVRLKGFLQLCRPANLPTSAADIIAGLALAGFFNVFEYSRTIDGLLLVLASVLLYAGGVVLNDVFDAELDKIERPERPIPSGWVKLSEARFFGFTLLFLGVLLAFVVNTTSGLVAVGLSLAILAYDGFSKQFKVLGPLNMGVCRGFNLLLGMSVFGNFDYAVYAIVPIIYIAAITTVSQGEVHGKNKKNIILAAILYAIVVFLVGYLSYWSTSAIGLYLIFLLVFMLAIFLPLLTAYRDNTPMNIKRAVKTGVISIILLDAAIAVPHSSLWVGVLIIALLPLSILLAKIFAVT